MLNLGMCLLWYGCGDWGVHSGGTPSTINTLFTAVVIPYLVVGLPCGLFPAGAGCVWMAGAQEASLLDIPNTSTGSFPCKAAAHGWTAVVIITLVVLTLQYVYSYHYIAWSGLPLVWTTLYSVPKNCTQHNLPDLLSCVSCLSVALSKFFPHYAHTHCCMHRMLTIQVRRTKVKQVILVWSLCFCKGRSKAVSHPTTCLFVYQALHLIHNAAFTYCRHLKNKLLSWPNK